MKVVLIIFLIYFCSSIFRTDGLRLLSATETTENGKRFTEHFVKYGEINEGEWFRPADLVSEVKVDVPKSGCGHWNEKALDIKNDYETIKDCLIVKISTNNRNAQNPVMVYIPGFDLSSGDIWSTSGHYLLDKNVVLVTVQYRVGVLGFLSTNTEEIPGNAGLHDVILALKWIKNHISEYGGDPNRITLFGQYKAAGLIGVLTMSPLSEGLFHQVIYQSGTALLPNLTTTNPLDLAKKVAEEINCKDVDNVVILNRCILNAKYDELIEAYRKIMIKYEGEISHITIGGPSNVLPGDEIPSERLENDKFRKYPTMGGVVDHPMILLLDAYTGNDYSKFSTKSMQEEYKEKTENTDVETTKTTTKGDDDDTFTKELTKSILDIADNLIKGLVVAFLPLEIDMGGMEIKTDLIKVLAANKDAGAPIYLYAFKYRGSQHYFPKKEGSWLKNYVTLLDDNVYLFDKEKIISENDKRINKVMIDLWTSFAKTGIPHSDLIDNNWPQLVDTDGPYLIIDETVKLSTDYSKELTPIVDCQSDKNCEWIEESDVSATQIMDTTSNKIL